jgi:hypothetical protein
MPTTEAVPNGQTNIFEGDQQVLLAAIADPVRFEQQCASVDDVKRAFQTRGFSTEGSQSMTLYGGRGKYGTGVPDACFVVVGNQVCLVKTSLSSRPEAIVSVLVKDIGAPQPEELRELSATKHLYGKHSPQGPKFSAFEAGHERGEQQTVIANVGETIHGKSGFRDTLTSLFRLRRKS